MDQILTFSATQLARLIRNHQATASEIVDIHIRHIQEINPAINAVVWTRFEEARQEAVAADKLLSKRPKKNLPPLLGVPFTVKESFAVKGMPNTSGLVSRKGIICEKDAIAVSRLKKAGAIPLGVTNTSELCMWIESNNKVYGRSNNPYNLFRIAGGSSGGEGAIISAGGSPFGLASDIAGSIRLPSFFNGVFGHKPSGGLVPTTGHYPVPTAQAKRFSTMGPIVRKAEDLMLLLEIMAGPDGMDFQCKKYQLKNPDAVSLSNLRVINISEISGLSIHEELLKAQNSCIAALRHHGACIYDNTIETFKHSFDIWAAMMTEFEDNTFKSVMGNGEPINPYFHLIKWFWGKTPHTLPSIGLAIYESFVSPLKKYLMLGQNLKEELFNLIGENGVMVFPSFTRTAPLHYTPMMRPFDWMLTGIFNVLEFPVTQVPLGRDKHNMPLGVQIVSLPGNDHLTIAVALKLEKLFGGWDPPDKMFQPGVSVLNLTKEIIREGADTIAGLTLLPLHTLQRMKRLARLAF